MLDRVKEPSSWAGLGGLLAVVAGFFPAWSGVITAAAGVASAVAVAMKDKAAK